MLMSLCLDDITYSNKEKYADERDSKTRYDSFPVAINARIHEQFSCGNESAIVETTAKN